LRHLEIAQEAKDRGLENLLYREEIVKADVVRTVDRLLPLLE
jgi:hypothetical protein